MALKKILIVENEITLLFAYRKLIDFNNLETYNTGSLEDARLLIKKNEFDAVITDLNLDGTGNMDGFEVVKAVKKTNPDAICIVISAYNEDYLVEKSMDVGAEIFLEKPVSFIDLKKLLAEKMGLQNNVP